MLGYRDYCFSDDGEHFYPLNAKTKQDAIEELQRTYDDLNRFEIGIIVPITAEEVLPDLAGTVLDSINENVSAYFGEYAEDYLVDTPKDSEIILDKMLRKTVLKWIELFNLKPTFYQVTDREFVKDIIAEATENTESSSPAIARKKQLAKLLIDCSHLPISEQVEYLFDMGVSAYGFIPGQTVYVWGIRKKSNKFKIVENIRQAARYIDNIEIFEVPAQKSYAVKLGYVVFLTEAAAQKALAEFRQAQS